MGCRTAGDDQRERGQVNRSLTKSLLSQPSPCTSIAGCHLSLLLASVWSFAHTSPQILPALHIVSLIIFSLNRPRPFELGLMPSSYVSQVKSRL